MGSIYFISPSGADANAGTSESQPWRSLAAAKRARAGDTVTLLPGTWREPLPLVAGLTVRAKEAGKAVISGASAGALIWTKGNGGIWSAPWSGTAPNGVFLGTFEANGPYCCAYDGRYAQFDPTRPGGAIVPGSKAQWQMSGGRILLTTVGGGNPNDEGVVIATGDGAITLDGLSDIHLDGILTRYWRYSVGSNGGRNIALTGCWFTYAAQTSVWLTSIDGVEVSGCRLLGGGSLQAHAEDVMHLDGGKAKIQGNEIAWGGHGLAFCDHSGSFQFTGNHMRDSGGSGITAARGVNDMLIEGNWIERCATQRSSSVRDVGAALQLHGDRHRVTNNHLEKNSKNVLLQAEGQGNPSSSDCLFERNTLLDAEETSIEYQENLPGGVVRSNIWRASIISGAAAVDLLSCWWGVDKNRAVTNRFERCQINRGRIRGTLGTFSTVEEAARAQPAVYAGSQSGAIPGTGSSLTAPPVTGGDSGGGGGGGGGNGGGTPGRPVLDRLTPTSGAGGTVVRAEGRNLADEFLVPVSEGARRLTGVPGTDTVRSVTMPADVVTGEVRARNGAQLSNPLTFRVTGGPPPPLPTDLRVMLTAAPTVDGATFTGTVAAGGPLPAGARLDVVVTDGGREGHASYVLPGSPPPVPDTPPAPTGDAAEVVTRTNQARAAQGLPALAVNAKLASAAQLHAEYQARTGIDSHTGEGGSQVWDRVSAQNYQFSLVAENIASGFSTAESAMLAWMNSPGHRANILDGQVSEIGIGVATGADGRKRWVVVFASPAARLMPLVAPGS